MYPIEAPIAGLGALKVSQAMPILNVISEQQGLRLSHKREFRICWRLYKKSILDN